MSTFKPLQLAVASFFLSCLLWLTTLLGITTAHASDRDWVKHLSQEVFVEFAQQPDTVVIDVRTKGEYARGYIPGAINMPHRDIISGKISLAAFKDKNVVFYCHTGVRAGIVTQYLDRNPTLSEGKVHHLKGDFRAWQARGKRIVKP
ncbi:MAG: rhodanese-like domain-containing protein [Cellvibrionaceae bacterium]